MAEKTKSTKKAPADDTFKVQVRKGTVLPAAENTETPEAAKQDLKPHHELVLEAPDELENSAASTSEETESSTAADEPKPEPVEPPTAKLAPDPAPEVSASDPVKADDAPEKNTEDSVLGAAPENPQQDMQSPTVFDTKQYHLPINESHAGGGRKAVWVFVLLLVLVVGALAAIDAEYIDLGFRLPFDLIK